MWVYFIPETELPLQIGSFGAGNRLACIPGPARGEHGNEKRIQSPDDI